MHNPAHPYMYVEQTKINTQILVRVYVHVGTHRLVALCFRHTCTWVLPKLYTMYMYWRSIIIPSEVSCRPRLPTLYSSFLPLLKEICLWEHLQVAFPQLGSKGQLPQGMLPLQQIFFWTTQVVTTPSLTFFWSTADFTKILKVSIGFYCGGQESTIHSANLWKNHSLFRIFIKSAVDQKNVKLGVVITWVISIVQKYIRCNGNMPWGSWTFDPTCGNHLYTYMWNVPNIFLPLSHTHKIHVTSLKFTATFLQFDWSVSSN